MHKASISQITQSMENSLIQERIYPRIETLDTILSIIPRRISKNPIDYQARKNDLINQALEEEKTEENQRQVPFFDEEKFIFPGEKNLNSDIKSAATEKENSEIRKPQISLNKSQNLYNEDSEETIQCISGFGLENVIKKKKFHDFAHVQKLIQNGFKQILMMKTGINVPNELKQKYNIQYDPKLNPENSDLEDFNEDNNGFKFVESHLYSGNQIKSSPKRALNNNDDQGPNNKYLQIQYKRDQDLLYKLLNNQKLKRFKVNSVNDFYLNFDQIPTMRDINKRAEALAKMYMKYHLKDEVQKIEKENEEKIQRKNEKDRKLAVMRKIQEGEDPNKVLDEYEKELKSQRDYDDQKQSNKKGSEQADSMITNQNDKSVFEEKKDYSAILANNTQNKLNTSIRQSQNFQVNRKSQQLLKNRQSSAIFDNNSESYDQPFLLGISPIRSSNEKQQILQQQEKELEKQKQQSHLQLIEKYYKEISIFLEQNVYQSYTQGKFKEAIKYKEEKQELLDRLSIELDCNKEDIKNIGWNSCMYSLPSQLKIAGSEMYQNGLFYGIDLASSACVLALDVQKSDRILDLCCAPATKLCYIADIQKYGSNIQEQETQDSKQNQKKQVEKSIIGVDISQNRINTSCNIVQKYGLEKDIQIICADGTTYFNEQLFDKVLVDAECTHDGSVKHLLKFIDKQKQEQAKMISAKKLGYYVEEEKQNDQDGKEDDDDEVEKSPISKRQLKRLAKISKNKEKQKLKLAEQQEKQFRINNTNIYTSQINKKNDWSSEDFEQRFMDPLKMANILPLQYDLLKNGFRNLKIGGFLVYSTCTFARSQNEDIVEKFVSEHQGEVEIVDIFSEEKNIRNRMSKRIQSKNAEI